MNPLLFFAARSTQGLEFRPLLFRQSQRCSLCDKWHEPFCHRTLVLYGLQQNTDLGQEVAIYDSLRNAVIELQELGAEVEPVEAEVEVED